MSYASDAATAAYERREAMATGYVWGRRDAGETVVIDSAAFSAAYADAWAALEDGTASYVPDISTAYEAFTRTGKIG